MTRRVTRRWPCQCARSASGVMKGVESVATEPPVVDDYRPFDATGA
jgi:hypothetical protein